MDYSKYFMSICAVSVILFFSGFIISIISSQIQCSKIDAVVSLKQGFNAIGVPIFVYAIATYFPRVRSDFASTLESFGVSKDASHMYGVGYITMLAFWISTIYNINNTEQAACVPSVDEMSAFKKKLMDELAKKQRDKVKKGQE